MIEPTPIVAVRKKHMDERVVGITVSEGQQPAVKEHRAGKRNQKKAQASAFL